jgi:hypothetical protein
MMAKYNFNNFMVFKIGLFLMAILQSQTRTKKPKMRPKLTGPIFYIFYILTSELIPKIKKGKIKTFVIFQILNPKIKNIFQILNPKIKNIFQILNPKIKSFFIFQILRREKMTIVFYNLI